MLRVVLNTGGSRGRLAHLRDLRGSDEALVTANDSGTGTLLLERLIESGPGPAIGPSELKKVSVSDRDRLFEALYSKYYGTMVTGVTRCRACEKDFEFSFSLDDLRRFLAGGPGGKVAGPDEEGAYELEGACRFRLPTIEDLESVGDQDPARARKALIDRCVVGERAPADPDVVEKAMSEVAPLFDVDFPVACPDCHEERSVRFDIQSFFLASLMQERKWLVREVHALARAYGWGLDEILKLTRADRRSFVRLIQAAGGTARRRRS